MTDKCIDSAAASHDFRSLRKEWQERHPVDGTVLCFSKEIFVCEKCGKVVDPWEEHK
jgi:hypothetical protein